MQKLLVGMLTIGMMVTGFTGVAGAEGKKLGHEHAKGQLKKQPTLEYGSVEMEQKLIEVLNTKYMFYGTKLDTDRVELLPNGIYINDMFNTSDGFTHCLNSNEWDVLKADIQAVTGKTIVMHFSYGLTHSYLSFDGEGYVLPTSAPTTP